MPEKIEIKKVDYRNMPHYGKMCVDTGMTLRQALKSLRKHGLLNFGYLGGMTAHLSDESRLEIELEPAYSNRQKLGSQLILRQKCNNDNGDIITIRKYNW